MNVEQVKALYRKQLQDEQAIVNFGHAALAAELAEDEDDEEETRKYLIEWHLAKSTVYSRETLETWSTEDLQDSQDTYYEMSYRGV
jgi:hypothetical protein